MVDEQGNVLPRKRRWPWVLAAVAGLIALLVAAGYLYNLHWQRKVDALFASYRAKGEPVTWEEVLAARDKLPEEENSALIFQDALAEVHGPRTPWEFSPLDGLLSAGSPGARPSPRTLGLLRANLEDEGSILETIHRGAALPSGVYPVKPVANPYHTDQPYMDTLRAAAVLCVREAAFRASTGDIAGTVESLVAGRRLASSLGECWIPNEESVRVSCDSIVVGGIQRAFDLGQFSPEMIARLRRELAEEASGLQTRTELLGTRAFTSYLFTEAGGPGLGQWGGLDDLIWKLRMWAYVLTPGRRSRDALLFYGVLDRYLALADLPLREQVVETKRLAENVDTEVLQAGRGFIISSQLAPVIRDEAYSAATVRTWVQVAEAAMAVEQWRLQHGRWPEALDELVPDVLQAVPEDPFCDNKVRYVRTESGVTVYSVGADGTDNGGIPQATGAGEDLPFRLLNPELRGAAQMTFSDEVRKSGLRMRHLEALGITAEELRALGVEPTKY